MFIYFFFAPTLLFRKAYPRTPRINWDAVFMNFLQVVMALFYTYYLFERFCVPHFRSAGESRGGGGEGVKGGRGVSGCVTVQLRLLTSPPP